MPIFSIVLLYTLKEKEAVKERWKEYFEDLMNVKNKDEAIVICMGITGRGGAMWDQEQISRGEVVKAINSLKMGKAAGVDGNSRDKDRKNQRERERERERER